MDDESPYTFISEFEMTQLEVKQNEQPNKQATQLILAVEQTILRYVEQKCGRCHLKIALTKEN